jgi:DNA-binding Lrp family transcriptional regulator
MGVDSLVGFREAQMVELRDLDEVDRRIVAALQVSPRANWRRIGEMVEVSASTAARRWARMTGAGLAWMSCHPMQVPGVSPVVGVIEVDCSPPLLYSVAAAILDDPHAITVSHVTGPCDLLVTAVFADHAALSRYIGFRLGELDGVVAIRSQVATRLHVEGSRWWSDLPTEGQWTVLDRRWADADAVRVPPCPDASDLALMTALTEDCRRSVTELAERTDLSPATVRRRLARLERGWVVVYRCDVARFMSGWPLEVTLWGSVPADGAVEVAARLVGLREVRVCVSITGRHNLMVTVWLGSIDEIGPVETRLTGCIPGLVIADRAITLWQLKIGGHVLDPQGRHIRQVPVTAWPDEKAGKSEAAFVDRLRHNQPTVS